MRGLLAGEGRLDFWGVAVEPDRPLLFGALAGVPVIGLPGQPEVLLLEGAPAAHG